MSWGAWIRVVAVAVIVVVFGSVMSQSAIADEQMLPAPVIYSGVAKASGAFVPAGLEIVAKVGSYVSLPVTVEDNGVYRGLFVLGYRVDEVGNPVVEDGNFEGKTVTFHLHGVESETTDTFRESSVPSLKRDFDLLFKSLPEPTPEPTPAPSATAIPTNTPAPTATAIPTNTPAPTATAIPTNTPVPTATPILNPTLVVPPTIVYSGKIIVSGGTVPDGASLVARVGGLEFSAFIEGETYRNLVVAPNVGLFGRSIEFFLNQTKSTVIDTYQIGETGRSLDLIFVGLPSPTPTKTSTPIPTHTPKPMSTARPTATMTPVPTSTAIPPPRATLIPTLTAILTPMVTASPTPLATISLTPTPLPSPTPTTVMITLAPTPTATPIPSGGGCVPFLNASGTAGLANVLALLAPVGMIVGYRRIRGPETRV